MAPTMKAVQYKEHGGIEVLQLVELPKPVAELGNKKVLVRVSTAALNPVDWKIRLNPIPLMPMPFTTGCDLCGVVEQAAPESGFKPGDRVWSLLPILEAQGALSEFVVLDAKLLGKCPSNLSDQECAALPLVGCTVLQSMLKAGITPSNRDALQGKTILVHAGAGGVGVIA